jgi:hypothetical protein
MYQLLAIARVSVTAEVMGLIASNDEKPRDCCRASSHRERAF